VKPFHLGQKPHSQLVLIYKKSTFADFTNETKTRGFSVFKCPIKQMRLIELSLTSYRAKGNHLLHLTAVNVATKLLSL